MKKLFNYAMSTDVQVGMRLVFATILLVGGFTAWAVVSVLFPVYAPWSVVCGLTAEQKAAHDELVGSLKTEIIAEVGRQVKAVNPDGEKKFDEIVQKKLDTILGSNATGLKDLKLDDLKNIVAGYQEMNKTVADMQAKMIKRTTTGKKGNLLLKSLEANWKTIQENAGKNQKSMFKLEKKVTSASFGSRVIFGFREAGVDFEALPESFIMDMISVMSGGPGSNPLSWVERQKVVTGAAAPFPAFVSDPTVVAEAAVKPSLSYAWVERTMSAVTIAALVPVTKQAIFNYPMLEQEVRFELMRRILLILQQQILKGSGAGGNMTGLFTVAPTLVTTPYDDTIVDANEYDVLVVAATQILNQNYIPQTALITHESKARMVMAKNGNGTYILPPFSTNLGLEVYGMKVRSTNVLTGDEFIVGDFKRALFNWVENPTIEIGLINDDFERNIWRIRCELQGMLRVREYEKPAFVKGDFSVAIASLLKAA